ncbi:MAG: preprotein translocase subunit SecE [Candidatus Kerfeldbacteria bacterium]
MANRISSYIREAKDELRKVVWPSRKQTVNHTVLVVAISLFVAVFLGLVDLAMNYGIEKILVR